MKARSPKRGMPVNLITEMKMPLWPAEYKRLVTGKDCRVEAKKAIKDLLEHTMDDALNERMGMTRTAERPAADRRNGYYERSLLTAFGLHRGDPRSTWESDQHRRRGIPRFYYRA